MKGFQLFYLPIFCLILFWLCSCNDIQNQVSASQTDSTIDFMARDMDKFIDKTDTIRQLVLKVKLEDGAGDLLKWGINTPEEHQARLKYFTSSFKKNISLIGKEGEINCLDSHFERTHIDLPYRNFILTFSGKHVFEYDVIRIADIVFTYKVIEITINS